MFTARPSASHRRCPVLLTAVILASAAGSFMTAGAAQREMMLDSQKGLTSLKILNIINPSYDPGKFNLLIDGSTAGTGANVGNGGTTGMVNVGAGSHTVGETAGAGTSLIDYTVSYSANCAGGHIALSPGASATCTITNERKPLQMSGQINQGTAALRAQTSMLTVTKTIVPSSATGTFRLMIDGATAGTGGNVANGGTTGAVVVEATPHVVTEAASPGTNLADYIAVFGGDCNLTGHVTLAAGEVKACTITNTLKTTHGTWTQGAGVATFTVCAYGTPCNINGAPGASVTITVEAWGAGGGGGGGNQDFNNGTSKNSYGGPGGGGGGGGGYGKKTITTTVPTSGALTLNVSVGAGGAAGVAAELYSQGLGGIGGFSEVNSGGTIVVKATGGAGGQGGSQGSVGGAGGSGTVNNLGGGVGGNGAIVTTCNGGAGGGGGVGGGPGAITNGGDGGHGGYLHSVVLPTCTAHGLNYELTSGQAGKNGFVKIVW